MLYGGDLVVIGAQMASLSVVIVQKPTPFEPCCFSVASTREDSQGRGMQTEGIQQLMLPPNRQHERTALAT